MSNSIAHGLKVLAISLGVAIVQGIVQSVQNYHPNGLLEQVAMQSIVPIFAGAGAYLVHKLQLANGMGNGGNMPGGSSKAAVVALFLIVGLSGTCLAQSTSSGTSVSGLLNQINIPTTIDQLKTKSLNSGFFYNWKAEQLQPTYTYSLGGKEIGTWGNISYLNVGYASPDVLVAGPGVEVNAGVVLKKWDIEFSNTTIQNAINNTVLGVSINLGVEQLGGKNEITGGPGLYSKITF